MKTLIAAAIRCSLILLVPTLTYAISAQWDLNPISNGWNTAANWTPNEVPNGPADTATFGFSHVTNLINTLPTEVNSVIFTPAATNPYTIVIGGGVRFTISGVGIVNNSGTTQTFVNVGGGDSSATFLVGNSTAGSASFTNTPGFHQGGSTRFSDSSTAGNATITNQEGSVAEGGNAAGFTVFGENSTAGSATINNNGSVLGDLGKTLFGGNATAGNATINNRNGTLGGVTSFDSFLGSPSADHATINNEGAIVAGERGGVTRFFGEAIRPESGIATAGDATIINNGGTVAGAGGGQTFFEDTSTAGNSTLIANGGTNGGGGGTILFVDHSTGGTSRIEVFGNGNLDISFVRFGLNRSRGITVGSIEGDGNVFLGEKNLTVGSNDLTTTFSGEIQDGGQHGGTGGSLTKIGSGTLSRMQES